MVKELPRFKKVSEPVGVAFTIGVVALIPIGMRALFAISRHRKEAVWQANKRELEWTVRQAEPLLSALNTYTARHKHPPQNLSELIPRYLAKLTFPGSASKNSEWLYLPRAQESDGWALGIWVRKDFDPRAWSFGDAFVYHSSGNYPHAAYGGILERMGRWAYYHE